MNMLDDDADRRQIEINLLKENSDLFDVSRVVSVTSESEIMESDSSSTSSYMFDMFEIFDMAFGSDDIESSIPKQISLEGPNNWTTDKSENKSQLSVFSEDITNKANFDGPNTSTSAREKQVKDSGDNKSLITRKRRGRPKKDPLEGWPKRPLSAYNIFFQQEQKRLNSSYTAAEKQNHHHGNVAKTIAFQWKQLSQDEKIPYKELADISMKKYRKEVAFHLKNKRTRNDFNQNKCGYSLSSQTTVSPIKLQVSRPPVSSLYTFKQQKSNAVRRRGRPKRDPTEGWPKRPLSGYNIFFKHERERLRYSLLTLPPPHNPKVPPKTDTDSEEDIREHHATMSFTDLAKKIGSNWKKLTEAERAFYDNLAESNMAAYREEMKVFLTKRQQEGK